MFVCVSGSNATIPVWSETPVTSEWNHAADAVVPAVNHVIDVWGEERWSDCQCRPSLCNSYLTPAVSLLCTKMFCRISPPFYSLSPSGGYCVCDRGSIWFSVFSSFLSHVFTFCSIKSYSCLHLVDVISLCSSTRIFEHLASQQQRHIIHTMCLQNHWLPIGFGRTNQIFSPNRFIKNCGK